MKRHYKVTYINERLNLKVEIVVSGDNKLNAIYNANCDISKMGSEYRCPDLYKMEFYNGAKVIGEPEYVKDYDKELTKVLTKDNSITCPKCDGGRYIPKFIQYNNGICYRCGGLGRVLKGCQSTYTITKLEEKKVNA